MSSKIQGDKLTFLLQPLGGGQDDGPAINYAFELCSNNAHVKLPYAYYVDTVLQSSLNQVDIEFSGAIFYSSNVAKWSNTSIFLGYQNATTAFALSGTDIRMYGGGTIDGSGSVWWSLFAQGAGSGVAGGSSRVFARPIPLGILNSKRVSVDNIKISNSPFWHSILFQSSDVSLTNWYLHSVSYNASAPAANSDGIDVYRSDNVHISGWTVINDDGERSRHIAGGRADRASLDCVSLKPNSTNVLIENMYCERRRSAPLGRCLLTQCLQVTAVTASRLVRSVNTVLKSTLLQVSAHERRPV